MRTGTPDTPIPTGQAPRVKFSLTRAVGGLWYWEPQHAPWQPTRPQTLRHLRVALSFQPPGKVRRQGLG